MKNIPKNSRKLELLYLDLGRIKKKLFSKKREKERDLKKRGEKHKTTNPPVKL